VLAEAGPGVTATLEGVRARYLAYGAGHEALSPSARLERDRLDSLLVELYGEGGLLAQAGGLITLRERLRRLAGLALSCQSQSGLTSRLRRETLILRAFAREQVARRLGAAADGVAASVVAVDGLVARLHGFCEQAEAVDKHAGKSRTARVLVDLASAADDWPEQRSLGDVVAFALHHLAESAHLQSTLGDYDSLCRTHASALRDELWESAEAGFGRRAAAGTLADLTALDLSLEALRAKLCDAQVDGGLRCSAIAELYALAASARATEAATAAQSALAPLLELVRSGIDAEAHP
jgi:hypothetical protein